MANYKQLLKLQWERYQFHFELDLNTAQKLLMPYCHHSIQKLTLLSDGCANSNYKVEFTNGQPLVIRIYMRENCSLSREVMLHQYLSDKVPIPQILYHDDSCQVIRHPFAVMEFVDGELMRDIILGSNNDDIAHCAFSAGFHLNKLRQIKFTQCGFLQNNLEIRPFSHDEQYLPLARACLSKAHVQESLGPQLCEHLSQLLETYQQYLPSKYEANLTHGDFDPSNILVNKANGQYQVAAILDWEFTFSCTYFLDMGMFLRYSHHLPCEYATNFIAGLNAEGNILPPYWQISTKLMDLINLLHLLVFNRKIERPKLNDDVVSLIGHTVTNWGQFG
jgi:Ser/Thr protein kinase RdoA (MazF antagonist)